MLEEGKISSLESQVGNRFDDEYGEHECCSRSDNPVKDTELVVVCLTETPVSERR
jgi:hypothetical protein